MENDLEKEKGRLRPIWPSGSSAQRGAATGAAGQPSKRPTAGSPRALSRFSRRGLALLINQVTSRSTILVDSDFALKTLEYVTFTMGWSLTTPRATRRLRPALHPPPANGAKHQPNQRVGKLHRAKATLRAATRSYVVTANALSTLAANFHDGASVPVAMNNGDQNEKR